MMSFAGLTAEPRARTPWSRAATPINYDDVTQHFDTSAVEDVVEIALRVNPNATLVIKSTALTGINERQPGCLPPSFRRGRLTRTFRF